MTQRPISLLIADDQKVVRDGLAFRLASEHDFLIGCQAHDAESAVECVIGHKPDVALLDMEMPGRSIFDAVAEMRSLHESIHIVFITAFPTDSAIAQALHVDACGIVTKDEAIDRIAAAIRSVHGGKAYFSAGVLARLEIGPNGVCMKNSGAVALHDLTRRECEVLRYVAAGMSKKDMAATMHLSVKTIENHTAALMSKLHIHNRVELTRFAIRHGVTRA